MRLPISVHTIYDLGIFCGQADFPLRRAFWPALEAHLAKSGSIEFNVNADDAFEALCAAILAEGHVIDRPDFQQKTVWMQTKITMLLGMSEPISISVEVVEAAQSRVHYEGDPGRLFKSWAHRTMGKIAARITNTAGIPEKHWQTVQSWKNAQEEISKSSRNDLEGL